MRDNLIVLESQFIIRCAVSDLIRSGVVGETEAGFSITQLAYRLGDAKLTDVIFQQRSLIDAQLAELAAQAEVAIAQANVDLALGIWKR